MKTDEKKSKVILALASAYQNGNTSITERVEALLLPDEKKLPEALQTVLDSWGNTPIDEPEFAKMIEDNPLELDTLAIKDLNIDDFNTLDIGLFVNKVRSKVIDYIDDDGKYKSTKNIDKAKLPRTSELKALRKMASEDGAVDMEINEEVLKVAGLKKKDLSTWEQNLVIQMVMAFANAVTQTTLGNYADRTPFARYIKN